jgi:hypothetical protein
MSSSFIATVYKCIPKTEEAGEKTTDRFTIFGPAFLGWQAGPFLRSHVLIMTREMALIALDLTSPLRSLHSELNLLQDFKIKCSGLPKAHPHHT